MKHMSIVFRTLGVLIWMALPLFACSSAGGGGDEDTMAPVTSANPIGGTFAQALEVSLTCNDGDGSGCFATFYTMDGSVPDQSANPYSAPITISETTTLRFFSLDNSGNEEAPRSQEYVIDPDVTDEDPPTTVAAPGGGTYGQTQTVSLNCADGQGSGCDATYYTLDGSDPTSASAQYAGPITIAEDTVLNFFSVDVAGNSEAIQSESYLIDETVLDTDAPLTTASPLGGSYVEAQTVSLTCDDGQGSGCESTYYTLDGSDPDSGSDLYSAALLIEEDTTLKFFSVDVEGNSEAIRSEVYQVVGQCTPGVDTDGDGLNDCDELEGWLMNLDLNGDGDTTDAGEEAVHVTSDPYQADADGDGLDDLEENQRNINPNRADTDQDGLNDFDELRVYFSDADHVDSDGDATGPNHDQLPDSSLFDGAEVNTHHTSPQMPDTDGDSFSDLEEVQISSNPLVADLPRLVVSVITAVDVTLHADVNSGCEISNETMNARLTRDESRSVVSSSQAYEYTSSMSDTIHAEFNAGVDGLFPHYSGSVSNDLTMSNSTSMESSLAFENESAREVTDEYRHLRRQDCFSETNANGGSISATIRVANPGDAAVFLSNMEVIALKRDRNNFGRLITLASVELFDTPTSVGASPQDVAVDIPLSASQAMELLDDPSGLFVYASRYTMTDEDGRDYAFIETDTLGRTGMLEIDYGGGRLERHLIATNVERDANNNPLGVNLVWAMENVLDMERGQDFDTVQTDGVSVLQYLDDAVQYGTDMTGYQGWLVMGNGESFQSPNVNFEDMVLQQGEIISLSFVRDSDLDGLFDKEEAFFGSDPLVQDTDGDMIDDKAEAESLTRHPVIPEFPAGQRIKQVATVVSPTDYTDVSTLVLLTNGSVWTLDDIPRLLDTPVRFEYISGGGRSDDTGLTWAGISTDGDLYLWGSNHYGKLGIGEQNPITQDTPVLVGGSCNCWAKVDVGGRHVMAIRTDGSLWVWGSNERGQLGTAASEYCPGTGSLNACQRTPTRLGSDSWHDVAGGWEHSLGIKDDLTLWTWGRNDYGQLGTGDTENRSAPTRVYDGSYPSYGDDTWRKVDAWHDHSLAALDVGANESPVRRIDNMRTWGTQNYTRYGRYSVSSTSIHYHIWTVTGTGCQHGHHEQCAEAQMCLSLSQYVAQCAVVTGALYEPQPLHVWDDSGMVLPEGPITSISAGPFGSASWAEVDTHSGGIGQPFTYTWNPTHSFTWGYNAHGETGRGPGGEDTCWFIGTPVNCNRDPKPVVDDNGQPFLAIDGGRGIGNPTDQGSPDNPPPFAAELNVWGYNANGELGLGPNAGAAVSEPAIMPEYPLP